MIKAEKIPVDKVNWIELLKTKSLIMWYKSSGTFLKNYEKEIKTILEYGGSVVGIIPNFKNIDLMKDYVKYYPTQYSSIDEVQGSVSRTCNILLSYGCQVFLHEGIIHYPCYVTDKVYMIGLHEFGKIKTITSPCFFSDRDEFIQTQIDYLLQNSTEIKKEV